MTADWWAVMATIVTALIALAALGWKIYTWRRQGPLVRIGTAACSGRGSTMVISATAHNAGRLDAFIAKVTLRWSGSSEGGNAPKRHLWDVPAEHIPGLSGFPKALPAQTDFQFSIADLPGLDPSLNVALHEKRWAQLVVQTASCQKARRKIKYK